MEETKLQDTPESKKIQDRLKDEEIIRTLFSERDSYEAATRSKRTEMQTIFDAYQGKMTDKNYPWKSEYFIPKIRTEANYILPFIYSGEPEFELTGVGQEDRFLSKEVLEKIVNYRLCEIGGFEKIHSWIFQGVVFGTSVAEVCWKFNPEYGVDRPEIEIPHILDVFLNPFIPSIEGQKSVIVKMNMSVEEVKALKGDFKNLEKVEAKGIASNIYDSSAANSDIDSPEKLLQDMKTVEVYKRVTKDKVQYVADGSERIVIKDVENKFGFINFVKFVFEEEPVPNRFYGKGIGQNTLHLQAMYYDLFNNLVDNVKILANKMWIKRRGVNVDPTRFISKPGGVIDVPDINNDVKEVEQTDIKQSVFEVLTLISDEHKRASGASDLVQGAGSNNRTLGQDQLMQANVSNRFELVKRKFKTSLSRMGYMMIKLEVKYLQDLNANILRIFPEESRAEIFQLIQEKGQNMKFDVKIKGDTVSAINKDVATKQIIDLFNLSAEILSDTEKRAWIRAVLKTRNLPAVAGVDLDDLVAEENPDVPEENETEQTYDGDENGMVANGQKLPPVGSMVTPKGMNQAVYGQRP